MSEFFYVYLVVEGVVESSMGFYFVFVYVSFLQQNWIWEQVLVIYEQCIVDVLVIYMEFFYVFVERCCFCCGVQECVDFEFFQGIYCVVKCMCCIIVYVMFCLLLVVFGYYYSQCCCNGMFGDLLKVCQCLGDWIIFDWVCFFFILIDEYLLGWVWICIFEVGCNLGGLLFELKVVFYVSDFLY